MRCSRGRSRGSRGATLRGVAVSLLVRGAVTFVLAGTGAAGAQQPAGAAASVVFDEVTVVDVEHGKLLPAQRVVIAGNRIQAVGSRRAVRLPRGAQVVNARGKYLIPGLWDMHCHVAEATSMQLIDRFYPLLIANGVTGIRDPAGGGVPVDTMVRWRQEVAAGKRIGPRALFTGRILENRGDGRRIHAPPSTPLPAESAKSLVNSGSQAWKQDWSGRRDVDAYTPAEGRIFVDSMKTLGADFAKVHSWSLAREVYFAILDEGRRIGLPVVGHLPLQVTLVEASDSGMRSIEHLSWLYGLGHLRGTCEGDSASVKKCAELAARFRRNGTWLVPTLVLEYEGDTVYSHLPYLSDSARRPPVPQKPKNRWWEPVLRLMQRADMPILAGTDVSPSFGPPDFLIHEELSVLVKSGLTPLQALQAATLNPAQYLHGTDSLGTVAAGKLADLVLLDANPLANIHNAAAIRAVVANGRYFNRAALDSLLLASSPQPGRER